MGQTTVLALIRRPHQLGKAEHRPKDSQPSLAARACRRDYAGLAQSQEMLADSAAT